MAMGRRKARQLPLWVDAESLISGSPGHPFYERLSALLDTWGFDEFVESACSQFYSDPIGRPSLQPGRYFRALLVGYFEGLDSERGIAWRLKDSLSLRAFLHYNLDESPPDHSTLSRTRRLLDSETHERVFGWVLQRLAESKLLRGKTLGMDATTLEANAAMRSIMRRDTEEGYDEYLEKLGKEAGLEAPSREALGRFDRKRRKKTSNKDWKSPSDPDSRITKMKDGRTHLAHKAEHAVDLETGAIVAVTVQPADRGDTTSFKETLEEALATISDVLESPEASAQLNDQLLAEVVLDKGYHSNASLLDFSGNGIRTYISEPDRGRRNWRGKAKEKKAVYANRRRIRGKRGRRLQRLRSELVERSFAHCFGTGAMRRTHLRGHENIRKRLLLHTAAFNLGLIMRKLTGCGTPRGLFSFFVAIYAHIWASRRPYLSPRGLLFQIATFWNQGPKLRLV